MAKPRAGWEWCRIVEWDSLKGRALESGVDRG